MPVIIEHEPLDGKQRTGPKYSDEDIRSMAVEVLDHMYSANPVDQSFALMFFSELSDRTGYSQQECIVLTEELVTE